MKKENSSVMERAFKIGGIFMFLLVISGVIFLLSIGNYSSVQNEFNDTSQSINFSGISDWSNLTYTQLPKSATINSAIVNITGFEYDTGEYTQCYQESANVSTGCGGLDTGVYAWSGNWLDPQNSSDGDWASRMGSAYNVAGNYFYINYSKPSNSVDSSFWEAKYESTQENISISSNCFSQSVLQLRLRQTTVTGNSNLYWECYSGSSWDVLSQETFISGYDVDIYEEAMWWNISVVGYPSNVTLDVGDDGDVEFNHTGEFSTENQTADFSSEVTDFLSTCSEDGDGYCYLPMNISGTGGLVQLSSLNIDYTTVPQIEITYPTNNTNHSTNNFQISNTFSNFSASNCWWTNDSGSTNNSMTCGVNISETWNEGTTTVDIYINNSDGEQNSSSVTFYVETQDTITFCRDLNLANTVYTLSNSVSTSGTCMNVLANNVTLNCGGNTISSTDGDLSDYGISSNGYDDFKLNNCTISNFGTNLYVENSDNFVIRNSDLSTTTQYSIYLVTSAGNHSVYNTTYALADEYVGGTSDLKRYWNYLLYVNDTEGNIVSGADVNIYNITGDLVASDTTDATGYISVQELLSYINNAGTRSDSNNHTSSALNTTAPPYVQVAVNSSYNLTALGSYLTDVITLNYDGDNPQIEFGDGTEVDYYNVSRDWIYVNTTFSDANFKEITFTLINDTDTINSTTFTSEVYTINWTGLAENNYTYFVNITDLAENTNSTLRHIRLDSTSPTVTIDHPQEAHTYSTNLSLPLNFSSIDDYLAIDSCKFNLINSTGSILISNTTITGCQNTTFNVSQGSGSFMLTLFSNDSAGNEGSDTVNFSISLEAPAVNLVYPTNNLHLNSFLNVYMNYTGDDDNGVNTCELYFDCGDGWALNDSNTHGDVASITGYFVKNFSETSCTWNVRCNDSLNQFAFASTNYTVTFDVTDPTASIVSPEDGSTVTGLSFTFRYNVSDDNIDECYFTIRDSTGTVHNYAENTSLTCSESGSRGLSVLAYGDYNITLTGKDKAGNEVSVTNEFTSEEPSGGLIGGGGGSTIYVREKESNPAENFTIVTTNYNSNMDMVLAKGSKAPRSKTFMIINTGIDPIEVELFCDSSVTLDKNQSEVLEESSLKNFDICDYVLFENTIVSVSPNEDSPTLVKVYVDAPEGISFGDKYPFNIIGNRYVDEYTDQYSKLSVTTRFPKWALVFKYSYIPFQDKVLEDGTEADRTTYPVFWIALLFAFIVFALPVIFLRKSFIVTGLIIGFGLFILTLILGLIFL